MSRMKRPIIHRSISLTDLESVGYQITFKNGEKGLVPSRITKYSKQISLSELHEALVFLGLQINGELSYEVRCEHITMSGKRTTNFRIVGEERGDKEWLKSPYASEEAKANTSGYIDMVGHLQRMQSGGDRS